MNPSASKGGCFDLPHPAMAHRITSYLTQELPEGWEEKPNKSLDPDGKKNAASLNSTFVFLEARHGIKP